MSDTEARHPIAVAAARAGVTPGTLRAWERRYQAVTPERSQSGRRMYSDEEVRRLALIRRGSLAGRSVVDLASMPTQALAELVHEDAEARSEASGWLAERDLEGWRSLVRDQGPGALTEALYGATLAEGLTDRWSEVLSTLVPWLADGVAGQGREVDPSDARLALQGLHGYLRWLKEAFRGAPLRHVALIAAKGGWPDQVAADFLGVVGAREGWSVPQVGGELGADVLGELVRRTGGELVVVVADRSTFEAGEVARWINARKRLPEWLGLVLVGRGAWQLRDAWKVGGLESVEAVGSLGPLFRDRGRRLSGLGHLGRGVWP